MKLSVVIPCRNEAEGVVETVRALARALEGARLDYELIAVDDGSTDGTGEVLRRLAAQINARRSTLDDGKQPLEDQAPRHKPQGADAHDSQRSDSELKTATAEPRSSRLGPSRLRVATNSGEHGFGMAVRCGIEHATGDAIVIFMADLSDAPDDVVLYARKLEEGAECVFGSRFIAGGKVVDYPWHKWILNRLANGFIKVLFGLRLNDTTNAFKAYRREVIAGIGPLLSKHFNLTVEMPLKAIVRGYSHAIVPISWTNRKTGVSKLKIREMGSRYLFIVLYVWLEKMLSRGDYRRPSPPP